MKKLNLLLKHIYILTPNRNEIAQLTGLTNAKESAEMLSRSCKILLKGGHAKEHATDMLFDKGKKVFEIEGDRFKCSDKHGTGCVLSSAIVANLSIGRNMEESCGNAKRYVEHFLQSNSIGIYFKYGESCFNIFSIFCKYLFNYSIFTGIYGIFHFHGR